MTETKSTLRASGTHAQRVIFVDLTRALAVILMIAGHTVSGLLNPAYNASPWFDVWQFQRGLTSSLFLLLSGFAFSVATARHWPSHLRLSGAFLRRLRRFSFFLLLGYTLHMPVQSVRAIWHLDPVAWRGFVAVDVLQLIGATFITIQFLVFFCRSRAVFAVTCLVLAALILVSTPTAWDAPWGQHLPDAVRAFFTVSGGSTFPMVPFAASVLIGAATGQLYAHWGAAHLLTFANRVLFGGALVLTIPGALARYYHWMPFGDGPSGAIPMEYVLRTGVSFAILGVAAHVSTRLTGIPKLVGALAQESLTVYYLHLCLVYGSIWSFGIQQVIGGPVLGLGAAFGVAGVVAILMVGVALYWNWCKHARPKLALGFKVAAAIWAAIWLH